MRRDYGYDAPNGLVIFAAVGLACLLVAAPARNEAEALAAVSMAICGGFFLANAASLLYPTWRGDEAVLDKGCGRGAVLLAVARRLTTGRVTGVDIWSRHDQTDSIDWHPDRLT